MNLATFGLVVLGTTIVTPNLPEPYVGAVNQEASPGDHCALSVMLSAFGRSTGRGIGLLRRYSDIVRPSRPQHDRSAAGCKAAPDRLHPPSLSCARGGQTGGLVGANTSGTRRGWVACRACMRKPVMISYGVLKNQKPFDPKWSSTIATRRQATWVAGAPLLDLRYLEARVTTPLTGSGEILPDLPRRRVDDVGMAGDAAHLYRPSCGPDGTMLPTRAGARATISAAMIRHTPRMPRLVSTCNPRVCGRT